MAWNLTKEMHEGAAASADARCPYLATSPSADAWYVGRALATSANLPVALVAASGCTAKNGRGDRVRVTGSDRKTVQLFRVKWAKSGPTVHMVDA